MKKRIVCFVMAAVMACSGVLTGCGSKKTEVTDTLTVFNYGEYMDPDVLDQFTEETGIEVKYEEALTPEEMYTKYKSGAIEYDLLCSTDYMLQKLISEGELQEIDIDALENKENIGDKYWEFSKAFDPDNNYTVPYFWGTLGILYDTTKVKEPVDSWNVLFNGEYSGEIVMQNSMRDMFMLALKALGYSLNSSDEKELKEAQELLLKQKPDVQAYLVDEARDEVVAGNATMAVVYSGEAYLGHQYNENLAYVIPKEGSNVWLDSWCVTKYCDNMDAAQKFLDFLCREDIAQKNFEYIYYSTPNEAVIESLSEEDRADEALVPSDDATKDCEVSLMTDEKTTDFMNELWKELKAD
ncbi:MAG: ABC transporter substrate-binding protein [Lachnospiraceae bacterium]|nr:ABC transporter substrate-binding protein [Lachnospiraceae bacterium]